MASLVDVLMQLDYLSDAEVLEVHREVSRRAQAIRSRDPVYQSHYRMGVAASKEHAKRTRESWPLHPSYRPGSQP